MSLVTLDEAKDHLNKSGASTTDDAELQAVVEQAEAILLNRPEYRVADAATSTSHTEWVDSGTDVILLQHYPITAVTSVTEYTGGTAQVITAQPLGGGSFTGYGWDYADGTGANGILVRLSGGYPTNWCGNRVKIVYTAGTASVPADIKRACLALIRHLWGDQRGPSAQPYDTSGDEFLPPASGHLLPWDVEEALAPYKRGPSVG